eukprot:451547-Pleurochrysis_carterae.AAC.1
MGKLGSLVYRQTDGDRTTTLPSLTPKHSHNLCDRCCSMLQEKLWGKKGGGLGCLSPRDMEAVVKEAIHTQMGEAELAWHWANYDWIG